MLSWFAANSYGLALSEKPPAGCVFYAGFIAIALLSVPSQAQFAQAVLGTPAAPAEASAETSTEAPARPGNATASYFAVEPGIKLPSCPYARLLSVRGVPERWRFMTMEQQVADPINAMMLQLVRTNALGN